MKRCFIAPPRAPDYYAILGIPPNASRREIKYAWLLLTRRYNPHREAPGRTIESEKFRMIREAHACLRDPATRARYDARYPAIRAQWKAYREMKNIREIWLYAQNWERQYVRYVDVLKKKVRNIAAEAVADVEGMMGEGWEERVDSGVGKC